MKTFQDNVVVLVGASRGIGEELAYKLAGRGARLILAARSEERLISVAEECERLGAEVKVVVTDITRKQSCKNLIEEAVQTFGRIDTLLYNAGSGKTGYFSSFSNLDFVSDEVKLNYMGLVYCLHHALPHLCQSRGRIVGVCSVGGLIGLPGTAVYNSAKHAMRGFLNSLRVEMIDSGVTVTVIYLSAVRTEAYLKQVGKKADKIPSVSPATAADSIIRAAAARRRKVIPSIEGKLLVFIYWLMPGVIDRLISRTNFRYEEGR